MDAIAAKVAARFVEADEHNPDPLTYKAFMSEFKQGVEAGQAKAAQPDGAAIQNAIEMAGDKISWASRDLLDLARRLEAAGSTGIVNVNEHRLIPKVSGILSTLIYNLGVSRGLRQR